MTTVHMYRIYKLEWYSKNKSSDFPYKSWPNRECSLGWDKALSVYVRSNQNNVLKLWMVLFNHYGDRFFDDLEFKENEVSRIPSDSKRLGTVCLYLVCGWKADISLKWNYNNTM